MIDHRLAKIREEYVNSAAYHEAGHAVIAALQGLWLRARGIHVDPEGNGIAYYGHRLPGDLSNSPEDQQEREKTIVALHAGRIAQVRVFPECPDANWAGDEDVVGALLDEMYTNDLNVCSAAAQRLQRQAQELVWRHWAAIHSLATELLSKPSTEQPPIEIEENWSHGKRGWKDGYSDPKSSESLAVMASSASYEMSDGMHGRWVAALSFAPVSLARMSRLIFPDQQQEFRRSGLKSGLHLPRKSK